MRLKPGNEHTRRSFLLDSTKVRDPVAFQEAKTSLKRDAGRENDNNLGVGGSAQESPQPLYSQHSFPG
jgi:hypothetical protein